MVNALLSLNFNKIEFLVINYLNIVRISFQFLYIKIGNNSPENFLKFVRISEYVLRCKKILPAEDDLEACIELVGRQPGNVEVTYADITEIKRDFNFQPKTDLRDGMKKFVKWYKNFYVKGMQENDLE